MIIRFSKKLSEKIHTPDLPTAPTAENPYLDWHATLFRALRNQYIMISNSKSLFSIFMHGAGITDFNIFYKRMSDILRDTLHDMGADNIYESIFISNPGPICIAKAQDRRVIGSMNEHLYLAKMLLNEEGYTPYDLSFRINENILTIINYDSPKEAFLKMGTAIGKSSTAKPIPMQLPDTKTEFTPSIVQEKPIDSGRHLRLWNPDED